MKRLEEKIIAFIGPLLPIVIFYIIFVFTLTIIRMGFIIWQFERVEAVHDVFHVLISGIRMDVSFLSYCVFIPVVFTLFFYNKLTARVCDSCVKTWLVFFSAFIAFMEASTPSFINEYDSRPNRIFIEYLIYPKEVFSTLWLGYRLQMIICLLLVTVTIWGSIRLFKKYAKPADNWRFTDRIILMPVLIFLLFISARSSFGHRPANISTAAFSEDHLVNDLGHNSSYSVLYSAYQIKHEKDPAAVYGKMAENEIIKTIKAEMKIKDKDFVDPEIPTLHRQEITVQRNRPYNLVIILEESMGAGFVKSLGGIPITPELEKLSREGLWFEQLYATGTRSVRGIEAVVSGFLPTPGTSVVKLGLAAHGFFTLADLLKQHGYKTEFVYGGESHFDNMRGFFLGNGFEKVIEQKDFINPEFIGTWGVSDEDLFNKAHSEFISFGNKPFFTLVFTSSNHSPFEFPDSRMALYEQPKNTAHNAVKYADYALGRFFKKARNSSYWNNTVFLVVADHDVRVSGASLVPIGHFHIPGLIIGPGITPQHFKPVASQIDLPPTLLSLIGISSVTPMTGRDLTNPIWTRDAGRAVMQYGDNNAYMAGNQVIILQPGKEPFQFIYVNGELQRLPDINPTLAREALFNALWPFLAYKKQYYKNAG